MKEAIRLRTTRFLGESNGAQQLACMGPASLLARLTVVVVVVVIKSLLNTGRPKQTDMPLLMPAVGTATAYQST